LLDPVTKLGKYHILEQVGEGAMGVVYRALDPVLNRTVAIKVMSDGLAQDDGLRARFLREAQAAGSLQHPNVVTIYDFGETDGHLFIAMEFVQGADLEHLMKHNAPLSLAARLDIVIDVLNGLYYAHRRGIVHRDIKPANIRVDEEGHARIMDFGVARLATSDMTKSGVMMGTPNYMAPEQISGGEVTPSVDIFSVGALLYELLTHVKPFQGDTMHNVLFKIVTESPPDIREVKPDLPEPLSEVVKKAIEKDPEKRYLTASEMANALQGVRATLGPARISKTLAQRVSARSEIDKSLRERREAHARAISMRRWRAALGVAAGVAALALINYWLLRGRPAAPPSPAVSAAGAPADSVRSAPAVVTLPAPMSDTARDTTPPQQVAAVPSRQEKGAPPSAATKQRSTTSTPPETATRRTTPASIAAAPARDTARSNTPADTPKGAPTAAATLSAQTGNQQTTQGASVQAQVPPPTVTPPVDTTRRLPAEPVNPRPAIASVIAAYARAIGTRQVAEIRRVYADMTPSQQSAWESFFSSVRSMTATFDISSLDVADSTATARLTGVYEFVARNGRSDRQPVSLEARLVRDGEGWRLLSIR
jgi:eukaryotic-like serine/threonine-protein kinase